MGEKKKFIEVNECNHHVLATIIDYIYGTEIPDDIDINDLQCLLGMADLYIMNRDGKMCGYCRYIRAIFSSAGLIFWLYIRKLAKKTLCCKHCAKSNMRNALSYTPSNMKKHCTKNNWLKACAISTAQLALCY